MAFSLYDAAQPENIRRTRDGYLVADVRIARTGIYHYAGAELGKPEKPLVRVYRPEDEVFKAEAMSGFAFRPLTNDHPRQPVTSETWKDVAIGMLGGEVARDGAFLRVPLVMMDSAAIADFENGKRSLSAGYTCDIEWSEGTTPDGEPYDAIQRNISANHLSLVSRGRAGAECSLPPVTDDASFRQDASARPGGSPMQAPPSRNHPETEVPLRKLVIDGISVEFSDQGAEAVDKLQRTVADAKAEAASAAQRLADAEKAHKAVVDGLEGQVAALRAEQARLADAHAGEIAGLKAAHEQAISAKEGEIAALRVQTSDEAVEARVAARSALVAQAKRLLGDAFDPAGKTDADIRKAAVIARLGDKVPADAGDSYMIAAFDTLLAVAPVNAPAKPDPLRQVIAAGGGNGSPMADASDPLVAERLAQERMIARDLNAWKLSKEVA